MAGARRNYGHGHNHWSPRSERRQPAKQRQPSIDAESVTSLNLRHTNTQSTLKGNSTTRAEKLEETKSAKESQHWTPYIRLVDNQNDVLVEINTKLRSTLEVADKTLEIVNYDLPRIEDSFTNTRDGIQRMAEQIVEANKSFRTVKHQIQARTEALNDSVNTLTSDIDKLRIFIKNIRDEDFESGEYYDIFSELTTQIITHLSKTHDSASEDLNEFRDLTWCANDIITKLDPIACKAHTDNWSTTFQDVLKSSRTEKDQKKSSRREDETMLGTIRETFDEIPDPANPRQQSSSAGKHTSDYGRYTKRSRKGKERSRD